MRVLRGKAFVDDSFVYVADGETIAPGTDVIVSLGRLRAERDTLRARPGRLGVKLESHEAPEPLAGDLDALAVVAITFPAFTDGRGYSYARLLRDRYKFRGEIRAVGHVLSDQLFYMQRCGFDAFELKAGKDEAAALKALDTFTVTYQAAADDPRPLFRRRLGSKH